MLNRATTASLILCGVGLAAAPAAAAQKQVSYTQHNNELGFTGFRPTAPDVSVSNLSAVVTGTHRVAIYDKLASEHVEIKSEDLNFPFRWADTDSLFHDPRTAYDPLNGRLWMMYPEGGGTFLIDPCSDVVRLHLAVSRDPALLPNGGTLDSFNTNSWWYYTGTGASQGNGGPALNAAATMLEYKGETGAHQPLNFSMRMPTMGFHWSSDERDDRKGALIVTPNAPLIACESPGDGPLQFGIYSQYINIIPFEHEDDMGVTRSILDGHRPPADQITNIYMALDGSLIADHSIFAYVVQAPYEQVPSATFLISTPDQTIEEPRQHLRLKGLFYDGSLDPEFRWTMQQRTENVPTPVNLEDIEIDASLKFHGTNDPGNGLPFAWAETDVPSWNVPAQGYFFHSAVLAKDVNGDMRIFATHGVRPDDGTGEPENRWVVQWYVIDPALDTFHSTPAPSQLWRPDIAEYSDGSTLVEASGRLESSGHSYHPVIVVNRQGQAFIEYTYSDDSTNPEIRRVRLNSSYSSVVPLSQTTEQAGPPSDYLQDAGWPTTPMPRPTPSTTAGIGRSTRSRTTMAPSRLKSATSGCSASRTPPTASRATPCSTSTTTTRSIRTTCSSSRPCSTAGPGAWTSTATAWSTRPMRCCSPMRTRATPGAEPTPTRSTPRPANAGPFSSPTPRRQAYWTPSPLATNLSRATSTPVGAREP